MAQLDETMAVGAGARASTVGGGTAVARHGAATLAGTVALVTSTVAAAAGVAAWWGPATSLAGNEDGAAYLELVAANPTSWTINGVAMLAFVLLTAAWVPAVWRLSVQLAPRWAWAAAVLGALYAFGQAVHLVSWIVLMPALAALDDPAAAEAVTVHVEQNPLFVVVFAPFLVGAMAAAPAAAVALWRGRVVPLWAVGAVVVGTVVHVVTGLESVWALVAFVVLHVAGFAPALAHVLRHRAD